MGSEEVVASHILGRDQVPFSFEVSDASAAVSDVRWSRMQDGFERMHVLLGSINTGEQQLEAQLVRVSKMLDQASRGYQVMVKQLKDMTKTLTRLNVDPELAVSSKVDGRASPPRRRPARMDQVCRSRDLGVAAAMPERTVHKVFDDLPLWDDDATWGNLAAFQSSLVSTPAAMEEIKEMTLMGSTSADLEQVVSQPLVVLTGAAQEVCDGIPTQVVVWDEMPVDPSVRDGLLQQLALGTEAHSVGDICPEFDEISQNVLDNEMPCDLDPSNDLLQLLALGREHWDNKKSNLITGSDDEDIMWVEDTPHNIDLHNIFLQQFTNVWMGHGDSGFLTGVGDLPLVLQLGEDSKSVSKAGMDDELSLQRDTPSLLGFGIYYEDEIPISLGIQENLPSALDTHNCSLQQLAWGREDFSYEMRKAMVELVFEYMCTNVSSSPLSIDSSIQLTESFAHVYLMEAKYKRACISTRQWDPGIFSHLTMGLASSPQYIQKVSEVDVCVIFAGVLEQDVILKIEQVHGNETAFALTETILRLPWAPYVISWYGMLEYHAFMCQKLQYSNRQISDEAFNVTLLVGAYMVYANYKWAASFVRKLWDPGIRRYITRELVLECSISIIGH